jgi:glycosyltransferase involved in cell wall biosynthesis
MKIAIVAPDNRDEYRKYDEPDPTFGQAVTALLEGFAKTPECEVHIVSCIQQPLRSRPKIAENIHIHAVLVRKWGWMRGAYVGCTVAARRKLREIQPEIVHGQGTERYCALAAVFSGFPNIVTVHGNMRLLARINQVRPFSFLWLAARLESFTLPRANGVLCISDYTRQAVAPLASATWIVPNAVDGAFFEVERRPASPKEIICVAHISLRKNQIRLIRALQPLAGKERFNLVFYGGANRGDPYVEEFFGLLEKNSWCRFAGFIDRPGLRAALGRATMLVLPSLEDNCPMSVLEAMAAGTPVAAANVAGVPELVTHEGDGILFDPLKEENIRTGVAELLFNDEKRAKLATVARKKALQRFYPQRVAEQHLAIYRQVLASRPSG